MSVDDQNWASAVVMFVNEDHQKYIHVPKPNLNQRIDNKQYEFVVSQIKSSMPSCIVADVQTTDWACAAIIDIDGVHQMRSKLIQLS